MRFFDFDEKWDFSISAGKYVLAGKYVFAGKHVFAVFAKKWLLVGNAFWWENTFFSFGRKIILGFWRENAFCDFGIKTRFCGFCGKHVFTILAGKHVFAILSRNAFLGFWREKFVFRFSRKMHFCGFVNLCMWQNDIIFRFVVCELHQGHNRHYTILNGPSPSKWSKLVQMNGL